MSSTQITSTEDFAGMVAIVTMGPKGQFDQAIKFARIGAGADQGKITFYDTTKFRKRGVECDGPILPHIKTVQGKDLGPKRPCVKIVATPAAERNAGVNAPPENDTFNFLIAIDLTVRAAYEFTKSKLGEAFPDLLTFYYNEVTIAPTRAAPTGTLAREVLVVGRDGGIKTLSEYLPQTLNAKQEAAIAQLAKEKRITEKDCIDTTTGSGAAVSSSPSKVKTYKTYVFENLEPRVDAKSKKLYIEMNLTHKTYPNGNRHYRSDKNPYTPEMSDIKQWGIEIPLLVKVDGGGYAMIQSSDWVQDPSFHAVTKPGEFNNFVGTVNFTVDSVMEGGGHVKTWWRASVSKQPEASSRGRADDFDEDIILPPTGASVALSVQTRLQGKAVVEDDD